MTDSKLPFYQLLKKIVGVRGTAAMMRRAGYTLEQALELLANRKLMDYRQRHRV